MFIDFLLVRCYVKLEAGLWQPGSSSCPVAALIGACGLVPPHPHTGSCSTVCSKVALAEVAHRWKYHSPWLAVQSSGEPMSRLWRTRHFAGVGCLVGRWGSRCTNWHKMGGWLEGGTSFFFKLIFACDLRRMYVYTIYFPEKSVHGFSKRKRS